jgi:hypothetical protein
MAVGIVVARPAKRPYGDTQEFVLNHQAIFAVAEEVKALAKLRATVEAPVPTAPASAPAAAPIETPAFVLVKGLDEGAMFGLRPAAQGGGTWIVGRRRGCEVPLDFDPYVSAENSLVRWEDGAHVIEALPESRNGTSVNLRRLAPGEKVRLRHGDLVGVGRCLLLYWA